MRPFVVVSILTLLWAPEIQPQSATGVIEGIVTHAATGAPIVGARVTLYAEVLTGPPGVISLGGGITETQTLGNAAASPPIPPITTDGDGKFSFGQLPAGGYQLFVAAVDFVGKQYGQHTTFAQGRPIYLNAGQTLKDLSFQLVPTGTLSGRVFDEAGQPATDAPVRLLRASPGAQGKSYGSVRSATVDDRGQYRLYGVAPGRYILNVGTPPGPIQPIDPTTGTAPPTTSRYEMVFYPGVADIEQATLIEIQSGRELAVDMRVKRQPKLYRVRGRLIDTTTGAPPPRASVALGYRTPTGGSGSFASLPRYDAATGDFELQNVPPGVYSVQARVTTPSAPIRLNAAGEIDRAQLDAQREAQRAAQGSSASASAPIRIVDSDVEGVFLRLKVMTLDGRIHLDGQPGSVIPDIDKVRVSLAPVIPAVNSAPVVLPPQSDGAFKILGLREEEYRVNVATFGTGYYVKSINHGGVDAFTRPLQISGSTAGVLDIVLRLGNSQINGVVSNVASQPVGGLQVVLATLQKERPDRFRTTRTDKNGRFTIVNVPPGDYKIFSWESVEPGAFYDPEFLEQQGELGQTIHLAESATQTIDVKMIPAQ